MDLEEGKDIKIEIYRRKDRRDRACVNGMEMTKIINPIIVILQRK